MKLKKLAHQLESYYTDPTRTKYPTRETKAVVSSGCTILDCACSDSHKGAFTLGKMINVIGDSFSGKTFLALSILAECCKWKRFRKYTLIYDDAEEACDFNLRQLFGKRLADRIQPPSRDQHGVPIHSNTIQDFHASINKLLVKRTPFIYILDSLDSVTSEDEIRKVGEQMKARQKGNQVAGSYQVDKPKAIAQILRMITRQLKETDSFLIIISQTRDNLDPFSFQRKVRSGGRALKFYCSHEIWLSVGKKIKAKDLVIGTVTNIKVTKNKLTGKLRDISFPIYLNYGIDDIGSCIDWLIEQGAWRRKGSRIAARELGVTMVRERLIKEIEEKGLEKQLKQIVGRTWMKIEASLRPDRKARYT